MFLKIHKNYTHSETLLMTGGVRYLFQTVPK